MGIAKSWLGVLGLGFIPQPNLRLLDKLPLKLLVYTDHQSRAIRSRFDTLR